jgi:hypothetical protein
MVAQSACPKAGSFGASASTKVELDFQVNPVLKPIWKQFGLLESGAFDKAIHQALQPFEGLYPNRAFPHSQGQNLPLFERVTEVCFVPESGHLVCG